MATDPRTVLRKRTNAARPFLQLLAKLGLTYHSFIHQSEEPTAITFMPRLPGPELEAKMIVTITMKLRL